jgi:hypothetical protein
MRRTITTVSDRLVQYPRLINSDMRLYLNVWSAEGLILTAEQRRVFLSQCTPAEKISRARRRLQPLFLKSLDKDVKEERERRGHIVSAQLSPRTTQAPGKLSFRRRLFHGLRPMEHNNG